MINNLIPVGDKFLVVSTTQDGSYQINEVNTESLALSPNGKLHEECKNNEKDSEKEEWNKPSLFGYTNSEFDQHFKENKSESYRKICKSPVFSDTRNLYQIVSYVKNVEGSQEILHYEVEIYDSGNFEFMRKVKLEFIPDLGENPSDFEVAESITDTENFTSKIKPSEFQDAFLATDGESLACCLNDEIYFFCLKTGNRYKNVLKTPYQNICGYTHDTNSFWYLYKVGDEEHRGYIGSFIIEGFNSQNISQYYSQCRQLSILDSQPDIQEDSKIEIKKFQDKLKILHTSGQSDENSEYSKDLICHLLNMRCEEVENKLVKLANDQNFNREVKLSFKSQIYRGSINISTTSLKELTKALQNCEKLVESVTFEKDLIQQYNVLCVVNLLHSFLASLSCLNHDLEKFDIEKEDKQKFRELINKVVVSYGCKQIEANKNEKSSSLPPLLVRIQQKCKQIRGNFIEAIYSSKEDILEEISEIAKSHENNEEFTSYQLQFLQFLSGSSLLKDISSDPEVVVLFKRCCSVVSLKLCFELEQLKLGIASKSIIFTESHQSALDFIRAIFQNKMLYFFQKATSETDNEKQSELPALIASSMEELLEFYQALIENSSKIFETTESVIKEHTQVDEEVFKQYTKEALDTFYDSLTHVSLHLNKFLSLVNTFIVALISDNLLSKTTEFDLFCRKTLSFVKRSEEFLKSFGKPKIAIEDTSQAFKRITLLKESLMSWTWAVFSVSYEFVEIEESEDQNTNNLLQSKILSGGIKSNFVHDFSKPTIDCVRYYCSAVKDTNLSAQIENSLKPSADDTNLTEDDKLILAMIHQGKDSQVDKLIDLLHQDLLQRDITAKVGGQEGMMVSRCAFAANIALHQYDESCSYTNLVIIMDQLEMLAEDIDPELSDKDKNNELLEELKLSTNIQGIIDKWKISNKMRIWLQGKRKDISNNDEEEIIDTTSKEESKDDTPTIAKTNSEQREENSIEQVVEKVIRKAELLAKLSPPSSWSQTDSSLEDLQRIDSYAINLAKKYNINKPKTNATDEANGETYENLDNKEIFKSCAASVFAALQSNISADEIIEILEKNYINAIFRDLGLRLLSQINQSGNHKHLEITCLLGICKAFKKKANSLAHYSDNIHAIGEYMMNKLRLSFFKIYQNMIQRINFDVDEKYPRALLSCLKWRIAASDHQHILESGIIKLLHSKSRSVNEIPLYEALEDDIQIATNYPNLSYYLINIIEYLFISCLSRIQDDDCKKVEVASSGSSGIKKIQQASSVVNTNVSEILMATSFDIVFSQINDFTDQGKKKLEEAKAKKDAELKKKLEQENIVKEDLKENQEEKKNKEKQDNKVQEDQKQNEQPTSEGTQNRTIGSGLFGSSNAGNSSGSLFGVPLNPPSSIFGQPGGDNPRQNFSGVPITEIGRLAQSSNPFPSSGGSIFASFKKTDNLFKKSDSKEPSMQEENFSLVSRIKLLRLVELLVSASQENQVIKRLCTKFMKPAQINILIQFVDSSSARISRIALKILTDLVVIETPCTLFEQAIELEDIKPKDPLKKSFFKSNFLEFLYEKAISINRQVHDRRLSGQIDDLDISDAISNLFSTILSQSSETDWSREIHAGFEKSLSSIKDEEIEEFEFWTSLIQGSKLAGFSSGNYLKDQKKNKCLILGFLSKTEFNCKSQILLLSKLLYKSGQLQEASAISLNTTHLNSIPSHHTCLSPLKFSLATYSPTPNLLSHSQATTKFLTKLSHLPSQKSPEALYKNCIMAKAFMHHLDKFGISFVKLVEKEHLEKFCMNLLGTGEGSEGNFESASGENRPEIVLKMESYEQRLFAKRVKVGMSKKSFFKCQSYTCCIEDGMIVLRTTSLEETHEISLKVLNSGHCTSSLEEFVKVNNYEITPQNKLELTPMEINEKSLFNNTCTVVLSVDDYTKFRKAYDPIAKQAEKYTKRKEVIEKDKTQPIFLEGEDVACRIKALKTHLSGSSGSSQESKSIFGSMNSISSSFALVSKSEEKNKDSVLKSSKHGAVKTESLLRKKDALEESKEDTGNSEEVPKEEIKKTQVVQPRVKKEAPRINMSQAISSFMQEIQPPSPERNNEDGEEQRLSNFFSRGPPSSRPKVLAKRTPNKNAPIKMSKLELIKGYTKILSANIFLPMLEHHDKEFQEIIIGSEIHTEKVFKMLTLLINQLYFQGDKKTRKASDIYTKITKIFRSLASNPTTRVLLERYVEEVVIYETFCFIKKHYGSKFKPIQKSIQEQFDKNESVNISLLTDFIEILMEVSPEICYGKEILPELVEALLLVVISTKKEPDLCVESSICLYKVLYKFLQSGEQDKAITQKLLNLESFDSILNSSEKLNPKNSRVANEIKITLEILILFYDLKCMNKDIGCCYNFSTLIEELSNSRKILIEGKKFELATYLNYFNTKDEKIGESMKLLFATASPRYSHSFRAKINCEDIPPSSLTVSLKSDLREGKLLISKDRDGAEIVRKIDKSNIGTEGFFPIESKSLYLHYPYTSNTIWVLSSDVECNREGSLSIKPNFSMKIDSKIKELQEGLILTQNNQLYCPVASEENKELIIMKKYQGELPQDAVKTIRATSKSYGILTESGKIFVCKSEGFYRSNSKEEIKRFVHIERPNESTEEILHWDMGPDTIIYTTHNRKCYTCTFSFTDTGSTEMDVKEHTFGEEIIPLEVSTAKSKANGKGYLCNMSIQGKNQLWSAGEIQNQILGKEPSTGDLTEFSPVCFEGEDVSFSKFSISENSVLAITEQGELYAWGQCKYEMRNKSGPDNYVLTPTKVESLSRYIVHEAKCGKKQDILVVAYPNNPNSKEILIAKETNNKTLGMKVYNLNKIDMPGSQEPDLIHAGIHCCYLTYKSGTNESNDFGVHHGYKCHVTGKSPIEGPMHFWKQGEKWIYLSKEGYKALTKTQEEQKETQNLDINIPAVCFVTKNYISNIPRRKWPDISEEKLIEEGSDPTKPVYKAFNKHMFNMLKPVPEVSEEDIFDEDCNDINPLVYFRFSKKLKSDIFMPVLELTNYFDLSNEKGIKIEITPGTKALGKFASDSEEEKYHSIIESMKSISEEVDIELLRLIDSHISNKMQSLDSLKGQDIAANLSASESEEIKSLPLELGKHRIDALIQLNKSYLHSINMLYDNHTVSDQLSEINENVFPSLMMKANPLGLSSIKTSFINSELERATSKKGRRETVKFNRVRTQERRDQNEVDHHGEWTMFATAMRVCKQEGYTALRVQGPEDKCWNAEFQGERSSDAGGPYRDSVSNIIEELYTSSLPLLIKTPNNKNDHGEGRDLWTINPISTSKDHLEMYKFLGALMAMAFRSGQVINVKFPSIIWKRFLGLKPTLSDLQKSDAYAAQHLKEIKDAKKSMTKEEFEKSMDIEWQTTQSNGEHIHLRPDSTKAKVLYEDVEEYCNQVIKARAEECDQQLDAMFEGFNIIVPLYIAKIYNWEQFEERIRGPNEISTEILKSITKYSNCSVSEEATQRFWRAFDGFTNEEKSKFLKFVWGRDRLPMKSQIKEKFKLNMGDSDRSQEQIDQTLPTSGTCYFRLYLPRYSTDEICRSQLLLAINSCGEIDND